GTLEIRMPDQPTLASRTTALAAAIQALAAWAIRRDAPLVDPARRGDYAQNRWAAARFGPAAELIHPDGTRTASVPELWEERVERVARAAVDLRHVVRPRTAIQHRHTLFLRLARRRLDRRIRSRLDVVEPVVLRDRLRVEPVIALRRVHHDVLRHGDADLLVFV